MGLVGESLRTKNHGSKKHIRVGKSGSQDRKITKNATTQNFRFLAPRGPKIEFSANCATSEPASYGTWPPRRPVAAPGRLFF